MEKRNKVMENMGGWLCLKCSYTQTIDENIEVYLQFSKNYLANLLQKYNNFLSDSKDRTQTDSFDKTSCQESGKLSRPNTVIDSKSCYSDQD